MPQIKAAEFIEHMQSKHYQGIMHVNFLKSMREAARSSGALADDNARLMQAIRHYFRSGHGNSPFVDQSSDEIISEENLDAIRREVMKYEIISVMGTLTVDELEDILDGNTPLLVDEQRFFGNLAILFPEPHYPRDDINALLNDIGSLSALHEAAKQWRRQKEEINHELDAFNSVRVRNDHLANFQAWNTRLQGYMEQRKDEMDSAEQLMPKWWQSATEGRSRAQRTQALLDAQRTLTKASAAASLCADMQRELEQRQEELSDLREQLNTRLMTSEEYNDVLRRIKEAQGAINKTLYVCDENGKVQAQRIDADGNPIPDAYEPAPENFSSVSLHPRVKEIQTYSGDPDQLLKQFAVANFVMDRGADFGFDDQVIKRGQADSAKPAPAAATSSAIAVGRASEKLSVGVKLQVGDVVRSKVNLGPPRSTPGAPDRVAIIEMDHQGIVRDKTPPNTVLTDTELEFKALKQAKMYLKNHKENPEARIPISGGDLAQAERVYAAILVLGKAQGIKRSQIMVLTPAFKEPGFFTSNDSYVAQKLPNIKNYTIIAQEDMRKHQQAMKEKVRGTGHEPAPNNVPDVGSDRNEEDNKLREGEVIRPFRR